MTLLSGMLESPEWRYMVAWHCLLECALLGERGGEEERRRGELTRLRRATEARPHLFHPPTSHLGQCADPLGTLYDTLTTTMRHAPHLDVSCVTRSALTLPLVQVNPSARSKADVMQTCDLAAHFYVPRKARSKSACRKPESRVRGGPVSYTHLTLPTIYSV